MIELYYWPTPNGHKITMFLEETGLDYMIRPVDISAGDQFKPDFLRISPKNRMPAIIDPRPSDGGEPISVFESGAILVYLAEKTGKLLPADLRGRKTVLEWVFWQVGGLGPMAGQNHHFVQYAPEKVPYATERYVKETTGSMAFSTAASPGANSSRAMPIRLPISPPIRGSSPGNGSSRTWTHCQTSAAGSTRCGSALPRSAPMPRASRTLVVPQLPRRARRYFSARLRRRPS